MSYQLISKNKNEMSKSIKGSTIIKLTKSAPPNQAESIYNLGYGEQIQNNQENQKDDNQTVASSQTAKFNIINVTAVTYAIEMMGNLS